MDKITKAKIEAYAWDVVVGSGEGPEWAELGHEPDEATLGALSDLLGHELTTEELHVFKVSWDTCLQECAQQ